MIFITRKLAKWLRHESPDSEHLRTLTLYNELIYAVGMKHKDETRHETALRYIRERENSTQGPGMDSQKTDAVQNLAGSE